MHRAAPVFDATLTSDAAWIVDRALRHDDLGFDDLLWGTVREVTLGPGARHDARLTDELLALRGRGNWAGFVPVAKHRRAAFLRRLHDHVLAAPPGSLAGHGRDGAGDALLGQLVGHLDVDDLDGVPRCLERAAGRAGLPARNALTL
ncbi:hypothetical protein [Cellulomonas xiejunii]|uniref:DUF222 domain-containing protein n=1 Tax=Cellulomonas xiejunii TaxID=2968083 RepID=A0ABY5KT25_9CELL|nr:hypothetical protein [Cellulomonas xiejunii]UUI72382.1 hypothetical protein NP048_02620 [Cellulomonas xiejunii]